MGKAIAFDTHVYVKKLKSVGFTEEQAEAQAEAIAELVDERLATKQDLHELEVLLRRDMKELELRLTVKLGALISAAIVLVAALVKLL